MLRAGINTVREGLRWHLIENSPGRYNWSTFVAMIRQSRRCGIQVIWDFCHYGCPDHVDVWSPAFVESFTRFAAGAARVLRDEEDGAPIICPINEISFWAWAGGEVGYMAPLALRRGAELKRQLARASIGAIEAVRAISPSARILFAEPAIHVAAKSPRGTHRGAARARSLSQFEAFDLICGRREPDIGGKPEYLDIVGLNYYPYNQWIHMGATIPFGSHAFRPFRDMVMEVHQRYDRPILIAETGAEGAARPSWLHYVSGEVRAARSQGVPVIGICLYPIVDYPGWDNDRVCEVGLLSMASPDGRRQCYEPLAEELSLQQHRTEIVLQTLAGARPAVATV